MGSFNRRTDIIQLLKFTAEISDKEIIFLGTCVCKGDRFKETCILDVRIHYKPTEIFQ